MKNCPAIRPQVATAEFGRTFDLLLGYKVGLAIWLVVVPHRLILLWSLCSKQEKKTLFVRKVKQDDRMVWQDIRERLLVMIQGTALLFHRCIAVGWSFPSHLPVANVRLGNIAVTIRVPFLRGIVSTLEIGWHSLPCADKRRNGSDSHPSTQCKLVCCCLPAEAYMLVMTTVQVPKESPPHGLGTF